MSNRTSELRANKILGTLTDRKLSKRGTSKEKFKVSNGLITLTDTQKAMLMRALEVYFPDMYVNVKYTKPYAVECEEVLAELLDTLDERMSDTEHFELYKDTVTEEYNFLVNLRLQHMVK